MAPQNDKKETLRMIGPGAKSVAAISTLNLQTCTFFVNALNLSTFLGHKHENLRSFRHNRSLFSTRIMRSQADSLV